MNKKWFTLIEIIVAMTIFMVVMVSVMQIFSISSNLANKIDINRQIQENIKNVIQTISSDIRKYWIEGVGIEANIYNLKIGHWLKLRNGTKYYIWQEVSWTLQRKLDISSCLELKNNCFLVKDDWVHISKLTNSWVAFEKLEFTLMWDKTKKLAINFTMRPSTNKWINTNLIQNSKLIFQTTISERFIKTN